MAYVQVIAGLLLLIFAGDFLVRGAVSIAQRAGVSPLVIGLTVVAFGTSAPELVVGIDAVLKGAPTLALGNVVGSNIANILLVIGLPALLAPLACNAARLNQNMTIMLGASVLFIGLAYMGPYAWPQGLVLLTGLTAFLGYSAMRAKHAPEAVDPLEELDGVPEHPDSYGFATMLVVGGLLGLSFGADMLVNGSVTIARGFGVSEAVIGLTLVAIGTSLPELMTALAAAIRGHSDVAVGNVIGSNIFNILGIIGVSSLFGTIPVPDSFFSIDFWVMFGSSLLLLPFSLRRAHIGKIWGCVMLAMYGGYMFYLTRSSDSAQALGMN